MKKSRIRAVFVVPSLARAGAETQVVNLVNGLDAGGFEKHLFVFERDLDQLDRVDCSEVTIHHHVRRHKFDVGPARQLAKLIDERAINIVHCSLQISLFIAWMAIRLAKRKPRLVLALHTTVNRTRREDYFDIFLYQWLMRSCSRVICVCQTQEIHWQAKFRFLKGRTTVVYNGVDTNWFDPRKAGDDGQRLRERFNIGVTDFVACMVAGFRPEKGHRYLLRAFARVVGKYPQSYLVLAGDGSLRGEMELVARAYGIQRNVIFLGSVPDVRAVLAAADISVIASTSVETFSIAMLESLAMRLPMVASDVGGTGEAVKSGVTGYLVPVGDDIALARSILEMAGNATMRSDMGARGRTEVCQKFTCQMMIENTRNVLLREYVSEEAGAR